MDFAFLLEVLRKLLGGLPLTLGLSAIAVAGGACAAVAVGTCMYLRIPVIAQVGKTYTTLFRGTPLMVQLFFIYYGLGQFRLLWQELGLWVILRDPFWCSCIALVLNTGAYGAEIFRGGLQSVPAGQLEAARSCGMSGVLLFRRIIYPIAWRNSLQAGGNEILLTVKATSLASTVTLLEVTGIAQQLIATTFRPIEVFICAGSIYLIINFLVSSALAILEQWLFRHQRSNAPRQENIEGVSIA